MKNAELFFKITNVVIINYTLLGPETKVANVNLCESGLDYANDLYLYLNSHAFSCVTKLRRTMFCYSVGQRENNKLLS